MDKEQTAHNPREAGPLDFQIGQRLRDRRVTIDMSQQHLGDQLGMSFQQIQKYEKGLNRISAATLWQIASVLGVPIEYFYRAAPDDDRKTQLDCAYELLGDVEGVQVMTLFRDLKCKRTRRAILNLLKELVTSDD